MTPPMLRQLRHDVWATETLIQHCRRLRDAELDLTVPGTYGTIRRTLGHIVGAGERYLVRLLGVRLHDAPFDDDRDATLDNLAEHLGHVKNGVERLFASAEFDPDRVIFDTPLRRPTDPRFEMEAWVPLTQFVHHGSDHRAQIGTILGAHGLPTPDLQVWPYAMEFGASRKVT
jgi:uncharacterized damage-inducible protein DinB